MGGGKFVLGSNATNSYALKADIKHYFDNIDHEILLRIIRRKIKDEKVVWLIRRILDSHGNTSSENGKPETVNRNGMPLGNLTSQFFANVYLNELDYFVKHNLRAKFYIRYVDDFVILHNDKSILENWQQEICAFLKNDLKLEFHPEKSRIIPLKNGITLLGFRVFYHYRLLKKSNARRIWKRLEKFRRKYEAGTIEKEKISRSLDGWLAYAEFANTYNLRKRVAVSFAEAFQTIGAEE